MDVIVGSTAGRDALRAFLRAGPTISDAEIQQAWDATVGATSRWIRPGYTYSAPPAVLEFVLHVAADVWRKRDSAGESSILPDGTVTTPGSIATSILKARHIGGPYIVTPRVVA